MPRCEEAQAAVWRSSCGKQRTEASSQKPPPSLVNHLNDSFFLFLYVSFFFFFLIYFNWRLITLEYCGGFCHTFTLISHGCKCVPHPEPPSHLPPHPIPQGHASAPALSTLSHASNLDQQSSSHMIIYMFQCYSLRFFSF